MIFIDEGFGCLDTENFIEVAKILQKLKHNFKAMVIITHIKELKAYADVSIDVLAANSLSYVRHGVLSAQEVGCFGQSLGQCGSTGTPKQKAVVANGDSETAEAKAEAYDPKLFFELRDDGSTFCKGCKKIIKRTSTSALAKHLAAKSVRLKHSALLRNAAQRIH
jgi:hypothetical protein